uniref:jerky protein homolog n=1 Tax=Pristiophorus japonicus TaxID=55135 RepID=UPI00398F5C4A
MWNSLPQAVTEVNSTDAFKGKLDKHMREKGVEGYADRNLRPTLTMQKKIQTLTSLKRRKSSNSTYRTKSMGGQQVISNESRFDWETSVLSFQQKLEIIKKSEAGRSVRTLMEEYEVGSSTIYDIKKQKKDLESFTAASESSVKATSRKNLRKLKIDKLDQVLYEWFSLKRSEGVAISGPMITAKAKDFKMTMNLTEECIFSEGWLTHFKRHHSIRQLDVRGGEKSVDNEAAQNYSRIFAEMVQEKKLTADQIYNADETGLLWRCLPTATLAAAGEKEAVGFKMNKERLTTLNCANASGEHRLSLLAIGKSRNPRALKGIAHLPVSYKAQKSAWMDKDIFMEWFSIEFVLQVRENMKKIGKPNRKCVLLLDNCRAHPHVSKLVSSCGNIYACYLPSNVTSLIQPMDQGIIQNFKCHYGNNFKHKLINSDQSISDFQRAYNIKDAIYACSLAWREIKKNAILKGCWRKLWPNVIFEDSASDDEEFEGFRVRANKKQAVKEMVEIVSSAHETNALKSLAEDDIAKWIDVDIETDVTQTYTDEELIGIATNKDKSDEEMSDSDNRIIIQLSLP